jgi:2-oxoisovalerate dehydrogenase E1 component
VRFLLCQKFNLNPDEVRKAGEVTFQPIPVNQYQKTVKDERGNFTDDELKRIYHDMVVIREFETMLNLIKISNEYNGVSYNHPGACPLVNRTGIGCCGYGLHAYR